VKSVWFNSAPQSVIDMKFRKLFVVGVLSSLQLGVFLVNPANAQVDASNVDALAKELANPGGAQPSMTNKIQIRRFDGDLPEADKQHAYTYVFQSVLPFPVADRLSS
jgi:hypothetical protein